MQRAKKTISIILAFILIFSVMSSGLAESSIYGDMNKDENVTAADALIVLQFSVEKITLEKGLLDLADVNADSEVNAADALMILQYSVKKIDIFDAELSPEERYYKARDKYYGVDYSDFTDVNIPEDYTDAAEVTELLGGCEDPSDVEGYTINDEGNLVYNHISKNISSKMDSKYKKAEKVTGVIKAGNTVLSYSVPKNVSAYDSVPVEYSVYSTSTARETVYLEATGYEETDRRKNAGTDIFDCTLPGKISVDFEYEGYVNGSIISPSVKPKLKADPDDDIQGTAYPAYSTTDIAYSGNVTRAPYTWFRFKYTNTGNTVLDDEGNGGYNFYCELYKKNSDGTYNFVNTTPNWYQPLLDYLYPGESGEMWLCFNYGTRLSAGEYKIVITGKLKNNKSTYNYSDTLLYNTDMTRSSFTFNVSDSTDITKPDEVLNQSGINSINRCGWVGTFEEFLTSFNSHKSVGSETSKTQSKLYLQVAPFTEQIGLKLINGNGDQIGTAQIPVNVESDSINVSLNPYNENYHINEDGTRTPLIVTQNMCDMRGNVDRGPDTASTVLNDLKNMKEAGINYITTTETATGDYTGFYDVTMYMLDCARKLGFDLEGHALYPYRHVLATQRVQRLFPTATLDGNSDIFGSTSADSANGLLARLNFIRYGDIYYAAPNGTLPISIEDNFGWLGFYLNIRYAVTNDVFNNGLRTWLKKAYPDISELNKAYGSNYESFDSITPTDDTTPNSDGSASFTNKVGVYRDWSPATIEMDLYRTAQRADYYKIMLDYMNVEGAKINMRTENCVYLAPGIDPKTTNPHYRSCFYEQRRASLVPEILISSGIFFGDSSYTSLAYSPDEVYELTRQASKYGINTTKTAQFNACYDTVVNSRYGTTDNSQNFNIGENQLSCTITTNSSLFNYWKALYEAGGVPGTMWMDYACDTLVTSTQYKEMLFFKQKINEMLSTDEGYEWSHTFTTPERPFESEVKGAYSYSEDYINQCIADIPRNNTILNQHSR